MSILKLKPACKNYIWGGRKLIDEFGIEFDDEKLAEAWVLSCNIDGESIISEGEHKNKTLQNYIDESGREILGENCRRFREFPIIIKFIDAKENLSLQVHPNNSYALQNEGQYGKAEMWYVLDAEIGSKLYYGFNRSISKEEFSRRIKDNTLLEVLNAVEVHKGDVLFIESGTLHAIGQGVMVAEIQQNSKLTYRVYDYGRPRELHIKKALEVTNRIPIIKNFNSSPHIADCDYFTVDKLNLDGILTYRTQGTVNNKSFLSILILSGEGTISNQGEKISYKKGDSIFLTAESGDWQIEGSCEALLTTIREKINPIRVGVNIGSSEIQIGIVDEKNYLLDVKNYETKSQRSAHEIINETAQNILKILEKNKIALEDCIGVGVGVAGTIDRREGKVIYSNNLGWKNISLVEELGKKIPCPVRIANNANCAALGETIAGAGKSHSDLIMITLGNGVGGGVIMDNKVFEGGVIGGAEVGHQVIKVDGKLCSCGRKGCLETYVSIPAILKSAKEIFNRDVTLEEIFNDEGMKSIVEEYTKMLGQGLVNIVNIFRPQLILIGGKMSPYVEGMIEPLKKIIREECFGGMDSLIPEIKIAQLGIDAGIIGAANL